MMDAETFARHWHANRTLRDVAKAVGVTASRVHARGKAMGLPRKQNPKGPPTDSAAAERVRALRAEGRTYRQIRAITGKGMRFVYRHGRHV
mgnify:FL=1